MADTTDDRSRPWATPAEAAAVFDVSLRTIRRALRRGELPGRKIGALWRVPRRVLVPDEHRAEAAEAV